MIAPPRYLIQTLATKCPTCNAPMNVIVGRKSTAREITCVCGASFDYFCWLSRQTAEATFHTVDLFPRLYADREGSMDGKQHGERYAAIVADKLGCAVTFIGWRRAHNPSTGGFYGATEPIFGVPRSHAMRAYNLGLQFEIV